MLDAGAVYVMRAAQSKGKVDLLALWDSEKRADSRPWLVQCKTGTARMSRADKEELMLLALRADSVPVLAEPGKNGRGVVFTNLATAKEIQL